MRPIQTVEHATHLIETIGKKRAFIETSKTRRQQLPVIQKKLTSLTLRSDIFCNRGARHLMTGYSVTPDASVHAPGAHAESSTGSNPGYQGAWHLTP